MDMLRPTPADRPSGQEILARLGLIAKETPTSGAMPSAIFVGRADELRALEQASGRRPRRATVTTLVHGESGVGKSFLVRRFLARLDELDEGVLVLAGRCFERESVSKAVRPDRRPAARVSRHAERTGPPGRPPSGQRCCSRAPSRCSATSFRSGNSHRPGRLQSQALRARMFAARGGCRSWCGSWRGAISSSSIDDLQWADKDSLELLAEVMRPPDAPRLLLVATMRMTTEQVASSTRGGGPARDGR